MVYIKYIIIGKYFERTKTSELSTVKHIGVQ